MQIFALSSSKSSPFHSLPSFPPPLLLPSWPLPCRLFLFPPFFLAPLLPLSLLPFLSPLPSLFLSWDTLAWPRRIVDQVEQSEEQLEQDEQKFHKKLLDDQTQLEDKLDTLQVCATLILTTQSIFSDIIAPVCWTVFMCELVSVDRNLTACLSPSTPPTHLSLLLVSPSLSSLLLPLLSFSL